MAGVKTGHNGKHLVHGNMDERRKDRGLTERPICFFSTPLVFMTGQAGQIIYFNIFQLELKGQAKSWVMKVFLLSLACKHPHHFTIHNLLKTENV